MQPFSQPPFADPRVRRYIPPARIVWQTLGAAAPRNPERLFAAADQATLGGGVPCVLKHEGEAPGLLLDFGRELHGGVQLIARDTSGQKPVTVRVRFGESVSEAMGQPNNDHSVHDQLVQLPWLGSQEAGNTGFRFVRLDLVEEGTFVELLQVRAVFLYRDLPWLGAFRCSDERLNRIWQTGAHTVHLCMQDYLWDGIKRDRLVWMGDLHPETMVVAAVFGNHEIVPRSLDFVRDDTPLPNWMNGISSYSLWWIIIHRDWYWKHGDIGYLREQEEYLRGLLKILGGLIREDGKEAMTGHRFLDWPSSEDPVAIHAGLHALQLMALEAGAELCEVLGAADTAAAARQAATEMRRYIPRAPQSKQASALVALAGLVDPVEINREVLSREELRGVSTFYGYYVLQARAKAGDVTGGLRVIRDYWGAMLDLGATSFWEDFDLEWTSNAAGIDELVPEGKRDIHGDFGNYCYKGLRHSLCHGWAAGPTAWLIEHVLGLQPAEPGCSRIRVRPDLGDLDFAEGALPTPHGLVRVDHRRGSDGRIETKLELPPGVEVVEGAQPAP
jgi:alpha-L-rhamnosidase